MKKINIILAALAMTAAFSCSYEEPYVAPETEGTTPSEVLVPLTLSTGEMTRTSLDGTSVKWTADDHIAVYDNVNYANDFAATSVDGSSAVFEGFVGEGTTDFYAVYPYSGAKGIDASNITVTLPSAQTSADGTFAEEHNVSVAHGVKTPGEENVSGIKFDNVCGLIQFTVPKRISAVKNVSFKAENRALAGDLSVSKSELKVVSVANGSNTVNMTGSFAAGSTFYFVVAPGEVNGFSITVTAQNGATYSKTSTKSFIVEAAAMKNLGEIDFKAEPSAEAVHTYENGVLTGTKVTLTPGLPAGMEAYVENLTATLIKNGVEYRKISKSSVSASEVMDVVKGRVYVPQGEYVIEYTYTLNGVAETKTVNVTVPAPEFTVSASAYTSYSKYLEGTDASIAAANACTPESMYDITLSASISQSVLNNIPMTSNKGTIYKSNGEELDVLTENYNLSSPIFHLDGEYADLAWGSYSIDAQVTFDGVTVTSPKQTLHITGLPYRMSTNAHTDKWTLSGGTAKFESSTKITLNHAYSNYASIAFHSPSDINVNLLVGNIRIYTPSLFGKPNVVVNIGGYDKATYDGKKGTAVTIDFNNQTIGGTLVSNNPTVKFERSYKYSREGYVNIENVDVYYTK